MQQMDSPKRLVRLKATGQIGVDYGEVRVDRQGIRNIPMRRVALIDLMGTTTTTVTALSSHIEPLHERPVGSPCQTASVA